MMWFPPLSNLLWARKPEHPGGGREEPRQSRCHQKPSALFPQPIFLPMDNAPPSIEPQGQVRKTDRESRGTVSQTPPGRLSQSCQGRYRLLDLHSSPLGDSGPQAALERLLHTYGYRASQGRLDRHKAWPLQDRELGPFVLSYPQADQSKLG